MYNYFTDIVVRSDLVLLVLAFFLIILILLYSLARINFENRRIKKLQAIKKDVYRLVLAEEEASKNDAFSAKYCSAQTFLDVAANRVKEGIFFNDAEQEIFKKLCLSETAIKKLLSTAAKSLHKWRRIEAMLALGYAGIAEALPILKKGLLNKDDDTAYFSAVSLSQIKNQESAKLLIEFLKKRPAYRYKIASFLGQFPQETASEIIRLVNDKDYLVRFWVPQIISNINDSSYISEIEKLTRDKHPEVRASACECLGVVGNESYVNSLRTCLKDEFWFVREAAIDSLERILGAGCIAMIVDLVKDNSWIVIDRVKKILAKDIETALPYLQNFISGEDELAKRISIEAIELAGYVKKLYEDLFAEDRAKLRAVIILQNMIELNAKGINLDLYDFSDAKRKQILNILKGINDNK